MYGSSYLFAFFCTLVLFHVLYNSAVCDFYSHFRVFLFIGCCFLLITASQYTMIGVFKIMSCTNTSWIGVACNVVWHRLHNARAVAAKIPDQKSSLTRWLFSKSITCTIFDMNWWIIYSIELTWWFSVVTHLDLIPY